MRNSIALLSCVLTAACGLEDGNYGKQNQGSASMAITNAEGETGLLRTGTSLSIETVVDRLKLEPNKVYNVTVTNLDTGRELARASLLANMMGKIELTTVAHDLGEFDDVEDRHTLNVKIDHPDSGTLVEDDVPVIPHLHFEGHGIEVDEVPPPHVFSADSAGTPQNSFVVGGLPDPGEVGAPIHVAGKGFPTGIDKVDLYIVKDADVWRGKQVPTPGDSSYVAGPVVGTVQNGVLKTVAMPWQPEGKDVGIYDILADVDRNGSFDYSFSAKDGADGEGKVGFTLQYGAAWIRTKMAMTSKHLLVNLAYTSSSRSNGTWSNSYASSSSVYSYVNPPVQHGSKHGYVAKLLVRHQSWSQFWNNPDSLVPGTGRIAVTDHVVQSTAGTPQQGCTNSPPVALLNGQMAPAGQQRFDVVFDYGKDGFYDIGVDFLDVVADRTDGSLVTAADLENVPDDQIFGFELK